MSLYSTGKKEKKLLPKKGMFYFKPWKFVVKEIEIIPSYFTITLYYIYYYYILYLLYSIIITESVEPHAKDTKLKGLSQVL